MKTLIPDSLPIPTNEQEIRSLTKAIKAFCKKAMVPSTQVKSLFAMMDNLEYFNPEGVASSWMPGKIFATDRPRFAACISQYQNIKITEFKQSIRLSK